MQKSPENSAGPSDTYVKAKTMKFFGFATEITEIQDFFWKLPMQIIATSLLCINIYFVKR
jgi:hypothetical protein